MPEERLSLMASETHYFINSPFGTNYAVELLVSQDLNQDVLSLSRYVLDVNVYRGEVADGIIVIDRDRPDKVFSEHIDCRILNNRLARNQAAQIFEVSKVDNVSETFTESDLDPDGAKPFSTIGCFAVTYTASVGNANPELIQDRALMLQIGERVTQDPETGDNITEIGMVQSAYNGGGDIPQVGILDLMAMFRKFVKVLPPVVAN